MDLRQVLGNPPLLHYTLDGQLTTWSLQDEVLYFLDQQVHPSSKTLETGCGLSTVVCCLKGAEHTCIAPFQKEIDRIKAYCAEQNISTEKTTFIVDWSEDVLPHLDVHDLDLVLIDGGHGFPTPFVDWYYASRRLKVGGTLVIDDVQLWTCNALKNFVLAEPASWKFEREFSAKTAVFTKLNEGNYHKDWDEQAYVVRHSDIGGLVEHMDVSYMPGMTKARIAGALLRKGKFLTLLKALLRKFLTLLKTLTGKKPG
jgi:hypothetical protein